uniref:Myoneurin n=1 Tax=Cyprinus carpio TaxID=7962 RepID=A0A8C1G6A3_CYPCA
MPHITHSEFLLEQLKRQRERSFLCDCTVVIGQSQYNAHHNVLAAFSEYFSTQSIDAGKENGTITLDPELVSGAVFEKLLTYIYTGDLSMDREEIESVQKAASYLGMPEVVARCTLTQDDIKFGGSPTRQAEYEDPRSPLSPDDYEPLEPITEVEEWERLRENKEDGLQDDPASMDEAQSSSEQTPQRSGSKRGRKPKTRLYEDDVESETITAHRGRGRGRGRPRGRPRVRPLTSDSTEQSPAQQTMSPNSSSVGRGTGRPRGRPRVRPLSTDREGSGNAKDESEATKHQEEEKVVEEDSVNAGEADDQQVKTDLENPDGVPLKRGRGRPRTKPLTTENQTTNAEDGSEPAKTKENEGTGRKRGRPRSKPLSSEAPEFSNPTENSGEEATGETNQDTEKHTEEGSSQGTEDSESNPAKKVRTSNRKRSLSRKLKESQASNEDEDDVEDEEFANDNEDWAGEEEVKPLQDKHRPICNVCGNLFSEMSSLRRHMRIHKGLKPYQCQLCTRSFRQGNQLKTHMRIHTGEKPFNCTSCEARFAQKCQLVYHCRMHHGEEKPHKCDFCGAAFATSSNLKIHIRKHSGEKPYECGECGKRFTQASTLMYHKRRHTGEKPYICDTCGMAFAVSSSLIAHTRKHTGVTPYICLDCGKPCITAGELRKHMDIHNDIYSLKKHSILKHNALPGQEQAPLKTDPTQCPLNIPIDHQGLIARVRSALVDSQDHEIQMEPPLPILPPETSLIIQQSAEPQMIIQHADGTEPSMIFQHAESSEAPVLFQHGESGEQVSYVVEQYEIPGTAEMEHTQIVIVQTID